MLSNALDLTELPYSLIFISEAGSCKISGVFRQVSVNAALTLPSDLNTFQLDGCTGYPSKVGHLVFKYSQRATIQYLIV